MCFSYLFIYIDQIPDSYEDYRDRDRATPHENIFRINDVWYSNLDCSLFYRAVKQP